MSLEALAKLDKTNAKKSGGWGTYDYDEDYLKEVRKKEKNLEEERIKEERAERRKAQKEDEARRRAAESDAAMQEQVKLKTNSRGSGARTRMTKERSGDDGVSPNTRRPKPKREGSGDGKRSSTGPSRKSGVSSAVHWQKRAALTTIPNTAT